ncbi:MAG: aminotransferase class III-fold pyridoxal phosphate-dependent enzyme, partial [Elusimicrobia bacterium]|nr:aminotransferase class III-fold pyridoxal phosphate-dependent enzyme [Elusimicrobiota bacterium]
GMRVMPAGYLAGLARILKKNGVPLIADEVATGFGRTGRMFAVEHEGVRPDFLCVAKALTGGYLPLAATLTGEKVYRAFLGRYEEFKTFFHGHSYTANPLACAVALENLRVYRREDTLGKLRPKRRRLTEFLRGLAADPRVGHVRQMGFMAGVELVSDKKTNRSFPVSFRAGARVGRAALARGVWTRPLGDVLVVLPPLGVSMRDLNRVLGALGAGIAGLGFVKK